MQTSRAYTEVVCNKTVVSALTNPDPGPLEAEGIPTRDVPENTGLEEPVTTVECVEAWIEEGDDNFLPLGDTYVPPVPPTASRGMCSVTEEAATRREEAFMVGSNAMDENLVSLLLCF